MLDLVCVAEPADVERWASLGVVGARAGAGVADWRRGLGLVALASGVALVLSAWWFARDLAVYGWPDLFGLSRHDAVVVGQPRWPGLGENLESVRFLAYSLFRSFWAQFGWMAVVIDPRLYWLELLLMALALGGIWRVWRQMVPDWPPAAAQGLRVLLAALGMVVVEVIGYNLSFIQAQGRYLYPAILPIGLLLALGWGGLTRLEGGVSQWARLGLGLAVFWLWAGLVEAGAWLLTASPAPLILHVGGLLQGWLASHAPIHRSPASLAAVAAGSLVVVLALIDAAALLDFVVPYFAGW